MADIQLLLGVVWDFSGVTYGIGMGLSHINAILLSMGNVWDSAKYVAIRLSRIIVLVWG